MIPYNYKTPMSKRFSQKHITFIYSTLLDSNRADNKLIKLKLILNKLRTRLLAIARANEITEKFPYSIYATSNGLKKNVGCKACHESIRYTCIRP